MKASLLSLIIGAFFLGCATNQTRQAANGPSGLRLGNHHFKVSTTSREAQEAFDRGYILACSFAHYAAEQEFRRAAALDPQLAMAWWGVALVNGPHINFPMVPPDRAVVAWEALTEARRLAPQATQLEQDLIAALAKRYASPQPDDRSALDQAYADALREVWRKYPTNPQVGALFAEAMMDLRPWDLWRKDGTPQPGTMEVLATLESTLQLDPKHPGANHLYIHAVEASPNPEKAIPAANRLRSLVPESGHMVHMPAHIYARVGQWDDAAQSNIRAMAADKLYRAAHPRPGFYAMYMAHNSHFYGWTAMIQGRREAALSYARRMVAEIPADFMSDFGPVVDGFLVFPHKVLMRFGEWDAVLAERAPAGDLPLSQALWRYTRAVAHTALHQTSQAAAERELFRAATAKVPAEATFGNNSATNLLAIAALVLDGEIAALQGRYEQAVSLLRRAIQIEDNLRYDEPPDWIQPVRHTLGAVLLKAGKPAEAEAVYHEDLQRYPENGWSLYGLGQALRAQNKTREAAQVEARFKKAWRYSDTTLTASCLCLK